MSPKPKLRLTDAEYTAAAKELNCEVAAIKAVKAVESPVSGFIDPVQPTILFESHVFGNLTNYKYNTSHPNISTSKWDRTTYGASGQHQHDRMQRAATLDREAALQAASWGTFQLLGKNWKMMGYKNLQEFINAMYNSEKDQLDGFVRFIKASPNCWAGLKEKNWAKFARCYNGAGYAANQYDKKIGEAYKKLTGR